MKKEEKKLNYLQEKELEDEKMADGLIRGIERAIAEKKEKESKYIITLWESHFIYNDLWNNFSILDVCYDLKEANHFLGIFSDKVVADGILHKRLQDRKVFVEMEIPDYKKEDSIAKIYFPPNRHNKVVSRIARAICASEYDKSYYYLELVEFPKDKDIKAELFNLDECKFEVESFFDDPNNKYID